jgi:PAS domain S-box-containing protein
MSETTKKSVEQKDAEAEIESFRKDLGPSVVAAETTRMAMVFTDATEPNNPIIFANDSFLSLTGYDREEVLGKSFNFLMAHGADAEALTRIKAEFEGSSSSGTEVLYRRKDGSEFWSAVFISPVRDAGVDIIQYFASFLTKVEPSRQEYPFNGFNGAIECLADLANDHGPQSYQAIHRVPAVCALAVARPVDP